MFSRLMRDCSAVRRNPSLAAAPGPPILPPDSCSAASTRSRSTAWLLTAAAMLPGCLDREQFGHGDLQRVLREAQVPQEPPDLSRTFQDQAIVFTRSAPVIRVSLDDDNQVGEIAQKVPQPRRRSLDLPSFTSVQRMRVGREVKIRRRSRHSVPHPSRRGQHTRRLRK